jgi:hypothetical protein
MKKILLFLLVCGVIGGSIGVYMYNKPVADTNDLDAEFSVDAPALFDEFFNDETAANARYLGKIIEVKGVIQLIKTENNVLTVFMFTNDEIFGINCGLSAGQEKAISKYKKNDKLTLRGDCAGYDMDVVLTRCVIIE